MIDTLGLTPRNAVVIGSGILDALNIRKSVDIDLVVSQTRYDVLKKSRDFKTTQKFGREVLVNDPYEIQTCWEVLGKCYFLEDLLKESVIINDIRYITLNFLYRIKKS